MDSGLGENSGAIAAAEACTNEEWPLGPRLSLGYADSNDSDGA